MIAAATRIFNRHRELLTFAVARVGGLALKPLIIFAAATLGRDRFAEDYALLISAVASLFVLTGGQTHIAYFKRRFGESNLAVRHVYERYVGDSFLQFLLVLPLAALGAWAWTSDPLLIALIVLLVGIEKFFDEDQRHFLFTKEYSKWSLNFGARVILPSMIVLAALWLLPYEQLIILYAVSSLLGLLLYLLLRRHHAKLYAQILLRLIRRLRAQGRETISSFWQDWRSDYGFNQAWTFTSINIFLVDRFWIAQQPSLPLDAYVFFDSILKTAVIAHSLFYYIPRRPHLIQSRVYPVRELLRPVNLLLPLIYVGMALAICWLLVDHTAIYGWVPLAMLCGMALFYAIQSIGMVVIETVFWRVERRPLVWVDVLTIGGLLAAFALIEPSLALLPWLASAGISMRLFAYLFIASHAAEQPVPEASAPADNAKVVRLPTAD